MRSDEGIIFARVRTAASRLCVCNSDRNVEQPKHRLFYTTISHTSESISNAAAMLVYDFNCYSGIKLLFLFSMPPVLLDLIKIMNLPFLIMFSFLTIFEHFHFEFILFFCYLLTFWSFILRFFITYITVVNLFQ